MNKRIKKSKNLSRINRARRSRLAKERFRRMYADYAEKQTRADQLREQVRQSWSRACRFDGIDPDASTVVFSTGNPHRLTYDAAMDALRNQLGANR